jgi:hypothetical protein
MALRLCKAKVTRVNLEEAAETGNQILRRAQEALSRNELHQALQKRFGESERKFVDYWFSPSTQLELMALIREIERISDTQIREFLELAFSAIIITKSGGVSLARDLAHTRPHRIQDKTPRSALNDYRKRLNKNLDSLIAMQGDGSVRVMRGNAQQLPLSPNSVDLIVTSPPYASNAIDYMRAHKFSLVWLGHSLDSLSRLRGEYIGHDAISGIELIDLPVFAAQVVANIAQVDEKKAKSLHRYYSEMTLCLAEMARVLKPGKAAVLVVGSSTMRGIDTQTGTCLGEICKQAGLELANIATRKLDRDKRMMPARRANTSNRSQIEERMHEEYVIGFLKSE